jgi:gamma-glutamylputrescine oxidase
VKDEVYWYARTERRLAPALEGDVEAGAVVVGGGMAGLAAAHWLHERAGKEVVLLEARFCGAGATGKSSGFITPDSELQLADLARRFGDADARMLWRAAIDGCERIRDNVARFGLECDYVEADSLFVANGERAFDAVRGEHDAHDRLGFPSRLYTSTTLREALGAIGLEGGVRTPDTFAIDACAYAQGLKHALVGEGVRVFEGSPAIEIGDGFVRTPRGRVQSPVVVACLDRFAPSLGLVRSDVYHAQTFIALTEPLDERLLRETFPEKPMLVWDTDLVYQYFRPTADGRLLVGGGSLVETFRGRESHDERVTAALTAYVREKLPRLDRVRFTHWWPGLIGVSKDLLPMAGPSARVPGMYLAMCSAGLPWSVVAGETAARRATGEATELDRFLSPDRAFSEIEPLQPVLGKPATFALSTLWAKSYQRGDSRRVARRQRIVRAVAVAVGSLAAVAGIHALVRRRTS